MNKKRAHRKYVLVFLILLGAVFTAGKIFPWGAVIGIASTHPKILNEAYKILQADPAFKDSGFPLLNKIILHEGVASVGEMIPGTWGDTSLGYGGPDKKGTTPYSFHYYNPVTRKGHAPQATKLFYQNLFNPKGSSFDREKGAAWSAHFLADMCVPYHVVGMPREDAIDVYNSRIATLSPDIYGSEHLYSGSSKGFPRPPSGWGYKGILLYATDNYIENHSQDEMADWYDPWYTNGNSFSNLTEIVSGSHVAWEFRVDQLLEFNSGYTATHLSQESRSIHRYHPQWGNPVPDTTFSSNPRENMLRVIQPFVRQIAQITRQNIERQCDNYKIGFDHAVQSVATLWRSTLTGLRPSIRVGKSPDRPGFYQVDCPVVNATVESVKNVVGRLTVIGPYGEKQYIQAIEYEVLPGKQASLSYQIPTEPDSSYALLLEVIGSYSIPDLQYAMIQINFQTVKLSSPPPYPTQIEDPHDISGIWKMSDGCEIRIEQAGTSDNFRVYIHVPTFRYKQHGFEKGEYVSKIVSINSGYNRGRLWKFVWSGYFINPQDGICFKWDSYLLHNPPTQYSPDIYHDNGRLLLEDASVIAVRIGKLQNE